MRFTIIGLVVAAMAAFAAQAAEPEREFSAKDRQNELAALRSFAYPAGYSDETIIALENGVVPTNISVPEYLRVHCGEMSRVVLNPCLLRHGERDASVYTVISLDGPKSFATLEEASTHFRMQMTDMVMNFENEVTDMNAFIDHFCTEISNGANPRDVVAARGGRPRLPHAIAPPNGQAKFQFSNIFQWEKCLNCVGIVAVNQPMHDSMPTCGALRKQGTPRISYFVVDSQTSRGHGSLDEGITAFEHLSRQPSL